MSHTIFDAEHYPAAAPVYTYVTTDVRVEDLHKGDLFESDTTVGAGTVTEVKVGRKWVYVTLQFPTFSKVAEVPIGTTVSADRKVETEASKALGTRTWMNRRLVKRLNERSDATTSALANVTHEVETYGAAGYSSITDLLASQAQTMLLHEFVGFASSGSFGDLVDAREAFIQVLRRRLLRPTSFRALSRSTSVMSNLLDDVAREADLQFAEEPYYI